MLSLLSVCLYVGLYASITKIDKKISYRKQIARQHSCHILSSSLITMHFFLLFLHCASECGRCQKWGKLGPALRIWVVSDLIEIHLPATCFITPNFGQSRASACLIECTYRQGFSADILAENCEIF